MISVVRYIVKHCFNVFPGMRTKYHGKENTFLETDLQSADPVKQFKIWFEEAAKTPGIAEANAMCLATASK
jgi:pyridoxamine 5'-phosphate oxidase